MYTYMYTCSQQFVILDGGETRKAQHRKQNDMLAGIGITVSMRLPSQSKNKTCIELSLR